MISAINIFRHILRQNIKHMKCFSSINSSQNSETMGLYEEKRFQEVTVDSFKELATDDTIRDRIELILSEYEYEKYTTLRVPTTITTDQMKDLLALNSSIERKKWLTYLSKKQTARDKSNQKRKQNSIEYNEKLKTKYAPEVPRTGLWSNDNELVYGLWHNSLFIKIPTTAIKRHHIYRHINAAFFGQKVVIDLDYDQYMQLSESRLLARQIHLLYNHNRFQSREPFDLCFTNCKPSLPTMQAINKLFPTCNSPQFMAPFHTESYLDLFPKENLLYLTPHADQPLKTYNPDDIYIVGGLIDKSFHQPVSYIKAKKEGIRMARLPIDENILWASGSKYLCLNHVVKILNDMSEGSDWRKALSDNIPKRKQKKAEDIEYEDMLRKQKLNRRIKLEMRAEKSNKS